MELSNLSKHSFPKLPHDNKDYPNAWSPKQRKLPGLSINTIDLAPAKPQLHPFFNSPNGGSLRAGKTPKNGPVRLIPLSFEPQPKDNGALMKNSPLSGKGPNGPKKFETSHVAIVFDDRPISELHSLKSPKKISFKLWPENKARGPSVDSLIPSLTQAMQVEGSPQSKFKAKLLTARVQEEDINKQLKKSRTYREEMIIENSMNNSVKRSGLLFNVGATLASEADVSKIHSKILESPRGKINENSLSKEAKMVDSIMLASTVTPTKGHIPSGNVEKGSMSKIMQKSPQASILQTSQMMAENIQIQPKKLFQRKNPPAGNRCPTFFMKRPGVNYSKSPTNIEQPGIQNKMSPTAQVEEGQEENKDNDNNREEKVVAKAEKPASAQPRKNEPFQGEIKGNIIKWKMGEFIGAGNFGQVYRAMEIESGKIIAVKVIPLGNAVNRELLQSLEVELTLLQKLKHKHIVQYLGHETINNQLHIYLEAMSGGNLAGIIAKYGALPEKTVKVYAKQILAGLLYLHENYVIHKDIKGANILVDGDGTVKLADFGCSNQLERTLSNFEDLVSNSLKGSIPWMAPEVVKETGYGRRSDIWSFGCTILEIATGKAPWSHYQFDNPVALLMKIAMSEETPLIPDTLSEELQSFLRACLQRDPQNRSHAQDLIDHPFLKSN